MNHEAVELLALESEAARAEAQLERDLVTARHASEQAAQRLTQLQAAAAQASGVDEDALAVRRQLSELAPPRFDDEALRSAAVRVRRQALAQRRAAGESFRAALEVFVRRTAELELKLEHQAEWLARAAQRRTEAKRAPQAAPVAASPRREAPRVAMYAHVDLGSDSNFYGGFSTNLSEGGLFIATLTTPPRGTQVELTFTLPGGGPIKAKGVVRWTREVNDALPEMMPGAGVQFTDLPPEVAACITDFVMKRDPLFYVE